MGEMKRAYYYFSLAGLTSKNDTVNEIKMEGISIVCILKRKFYSNNNG
jgi:hypothetical protein